jgi:hypothetical protein
MRMSHDVAGMSHTGNVRHGNISPAFSLGEYQIAPSTTKNQRELSGSAVRLRHSLEGRTKAPPRIAQQS